MAKVIGSCGKLSSFGMLEYDNTKGSTEGQETTEVESYGLKKIFGNGVERKDVGERHGDDTPFFTFLSTTSAWDNG